MPAPIVDTALSQVTILPKKWNNRIDVSPQLVESARAEVTEVLSMLNTSPAGLTPAGVVERQQSYRPNEVAAEVKHGWLWLINKNRKTSPSHVTFCNQLKSTKLNVGIFLLKANKEIFQ